MRMVKRSVNQDSPGTYHLFYADGDGHPGTDITFFPWPEMAPAKAGVGLAMEVSLAVPLGSTDYWVDRLADHHLQIGEFVAELRHCRSSIHTDFRLFFTRLATIAPSHRGGRVQCRSRDRFADFTPCGSGSGISD